MAGLIRRWRRRRLRRTPVPAAWSDILARTAPFVARLSPAERAKLLRDVQVFVAEKHFVGAGGLEVTDEMIVTIAAAAARLVVHLDVARYDHLTEIVVYPSAYRHADTDGAVLGEAHGWGVVVLAWDAVTVGLRNTGDGLDTAAHEFAHVLDRTDGSFDGAPELRAREDYRPWAAAMQRNFDRLRARDRALGRVLRDYGATNPAEFFAVATEAYFERPDALRAKAPALHQALERFYRG
ncbi:MAG: zinc-dependent peptidase [Myxococcales bacterium]|nr:zinc-dependent peptidase [Myxococcales bacterium]